MKNLKAIALILFTTLVACNSPQDGTFPITQYGAKPGEGNMNTTAIQRAINECNEAGGGMVVIPTGTWYSGNLELLSNVHLYLETGAVLKGSPDIDDFRSGQGLGRGLLFAFNQKNITISGDGEINGNGTIYHDDTRPHDAGDFERKYIRQGEEYMKEGFDFSDGPIWKGVRPGMTLVLINCEDVNIRDIRITDPPSWAVKIAHCDNVIIRGVSIFTNLLIPNSDGIHTTSSRNITISDCDIRAGDDAIIVTGFNEDAGLRETLLDPSVTEIYGNPRQISENITVTNCLLQSRSSGIRVGYGVYPIRNVIFSNLVIYDSNRGLGIFARDNATIENILFDNIIIRNRLHSGHWWGNGEPIHVSTTPQKENSAGGDVRNIRFSNIIADSETGIVVWGSNYNRISDIQFHNVQLRIHNSPLADSYGGNIDLRPAYPVQEDIFAFDLPGLYIQKTDGVSIRDFELIWDNDVPDYYTHGIHMKDVTGFFMDQQSTTPARPGSGLTPVKKE